MLNDIEMVGTSTGNRFSFNGVASVFVDAHTGERILFVPRNVRSVIGQIFGDEAGSIVLSAESGHLAFARHRRKKADERMRAKLVPRVCISLRDNHRPFRFGTIDYHQNILVYPTLDHAIIA